jgi:hypothetical protein
MITSGLIQARYEKSSKLTVRQNSSNPVTETHTHKTHTKLIESTDDSAEYEG